VTLRSPGAVAAAVGVMAAIVMALTIQAAGPATNDPDSAASVLYFQHLVSGDRLDAFVATTPKPLLTLVYGVAWTLTGDWRTLGWITIAVFGLAAACGTELLRRLAGPAAAAFLAVVMVLSPVMAIEVSRANSLIWAIAAWAVAALALSLPRPRVWLAGLALFVAVLCRTETVLVLLATSAWLVDLLVRGDGMTARRFAPLLLAWLAIPIASLHDVLLTGDPLYWLSVPAGYTAIVAPDIQPPRPAQLIGDVIARYAGMPGLVALGAVGVARLAYDRRWPALVALACLTLGVTAFLLVISWRGVYVTVRYLEQVDVGLVVVAAVGAGTIADLLVRRMGGGGQAGTDRSTVAVVGVVVATVAAIALNLPPAQMDGALAAELDRVRTASRNADLVKPQLTALLAAGRGDVPAAIAGPGRTLVVDTTHASILVPRSLMNRLLVDLDAPLTRLGDSWLAFREDGPLASVRPGQAVYHDHAADGRPGIFGPLETDAAIDSAAVRLEPTFVDAPAGIWIFDASAP
jgi:hypothetical protein